MRNIIVIIGIMLAIIAYYGCARHGDWHEATWIATGLLLWMVIEHMRREYIKLIELYARCRWADRTPGTAPLEENREVARLVREFDQEKRDLSPNGDTHNE